MREMEKEKEALSTFNGNKVNEKQEQETEWD